MNPDGQEYGLDRQLALSRVGGDEDLLREIAAIFIEEYPKTLDELRKAIADGDAATLERSAHGLKGAVANFSARSAVSLALELENMGRARDLAQANPTLERLRQTLIALESELGTL